MADGLHISTQSSRNQIQVVTAGIFWWFWVGRIVIHTDLLNDWVVMIGDGMDKVQAVHFISK